MTRLHTFLTSLGTLIGITKYLIFHDLSMPLVIPIVYSTTVQVTSSASLQDALVFLVRIYCATSAEEAVTHKRRAQNVALSTTMCGCIARTDWSDHFLSTQKAENDKGSHSCSFCAISRLPQASRSVFMLESENDSIAHLYLLCCS